MLKLPNVLNGNSCSIYSDPSLILVSGLCGRFSVNGTDSVQMVNAIPSGAKFQFRILLTICPNREPIGLSMPGYPLTVVLY